MQTDNPFAVPEFPDRLLPDTSIGLIPLLLLRSLLTGRWLPLLLSAVCGGISGWLCLDWRAVCMGAMMAGLSVLLFGWPRSSELPND